MNALNRLADFFQAQGLMTLSLNPPASAEAIEAAEAELGFRMPEEVRQAYLRFDGTKRSGGFLDRGPHLPPGPFLFLSDYDWLSLDEMITRLRMQRQFREQPWAAEVWSDIPEEDIPPNQAVVPRDWHARWIPIGASRISDTYYGVYADMAPARAGVEGQIVCTTDDGPYVMSTSFNGWIRRLLAAHAAGTMAWDESGWWLSPSGRIVMNLDEVETWPSA